MTPDELRALADALDHMIPVTWPEKMHDMAALIQAVAYLRACADVQPVRAVPIGHALSAVRHVGSANYPDRERAAIERLYSAEFDAYAHPAPAAPQGDASRMIDALQSIRAHVEHDPSALAAAIVATCDNALNAAPQAEPKREPNPDEVICPACTHQFRAIPENVQKQLWAKREPLSDALKEQR